MVDPNINNPKKPLFYIKKYLDKKKSFYNDKIVLDIPAGNGGTTELLLENGAKAEPFDLFPEYFFLKNIECKRANILDKIPVEENHADLIICQEGIEHFSDQLKAFKEFNRALKMNGELLITTPSYSCLASRFSYLLFESETNKHMPPNEINDVWMVDKSISEEMYHGHIFLVGLQKLRTLAKLAGFRIKENLYVRISKGSVVLFPVFFPFIFISSYLRYYRNMKKNKEVPQEYKRKVYREQLMLNISPKNLLNKHTFILFEKEKQLNEVDFRLESIIKPFDSNP